MATHVDIVAQFDDRSVMVSANDLKRNVERTGDETGQAWGEGFTRGADGRIRNARGQFVKVGQDIGSDVAKGMGEGLDRGLPAFQSGMSKAVSSTRAYKDEFKKLQDLMRDRAPWELVAQQSERVAGAHNLARDAARGAGDAFKELENAGKGLTDTVGGLAEGMSKLASVGPAAIIAISGAAVELGGVAASAAQSLLLIPAAAGAAGAAIGTVALATWGFGDALKAVGDPQKFGDALKQLSPNAQQAALSIQALMPFVTDLRKATSDAFFSNVGPQLNQLANQLLPTITTLTTGVASAMNQMFSALSTELMTPAMQSNIKAITDNIVSAFHELAPAIAPLTRAFADLIAVGSDFLPDIARGAADAARGFADFMREARQSGELHTWLSDGLSTLNQLGHIAFDVGKSFMSLAHTGQTELPKITQEIKELADSMSVLVRIMEVVGHTAQLIYDPVQGVRNLAADFGIIDKPTAAPGPSGSGRSDDTSWTPSAAGIPPVPPGGYGFPNSSWFPGQQKPGTIGGPPAIKTGSGSGSNLPAAPVTPYNTSLPPGFAGVPQTAEVVSAENTWMDARQALTEKQARVQQLEKTVGATAADITKAKNDVINAQQAQNEATLRLNETQNKQIKNQTAQLTQFGVALDQDLGISKGLAGIADNLVRFLGSLAAAPWEAKMNAISTAPGQAQGGYGLIGQLGAQGAFGPQYTAAGQAAAANGGASALGPAGLAPGAGFANPNVNAMIAAAQAGSGGKYAAASDLVNGLSDCSGAVSDLYEILKTGQSTPARDFSTANFATPAGAAALGFQPGYAPGAFNVGVHQGGPGGGHMAATLPNGVNFESGGGTGQGATYGGRAVGALNPEFESQYHIPIGTSGIAGTGDGLGRQQMGHIGRGFGAYDANLPAGGGNINPNFGIDTSTTSVAPPYDPNRIGMHDIENMVNGEHTRAPEDSSRFAGTGFVGGAPPLGPNIGPSPLGGGIGGSAGQYGGPSSPFGPGGALSAIPNIGPGPLQVGPPGAGPMGGPSGQIGPFPTPPGIGGPAPVGGVGAGAMPGGPMAGGTQIGAAVAPAGGTGKGGIGASDSTMALAGMAASALDVMAPGAGQAAQTAMKLANRAIQYGGQVAGIGVQGLMQTFLPTGGSELANNSWLTKIVGGLAGAAPALPNMAGKPAAPPPPGSPASGNGSGPAPGPGGDIYNIDATSRNTGQGIANDLAFHKQTSQQPPGKL